jgi:hypothetical protein
MERSRRRRSVSAATASRRRCELAGKAPGGGGR